VIIPTYDEAENILEILRRVEAVLPAIEVLVVDDNSPDGTAALAEAVGRRTGRVEVLRRPRKGGLGAAYRAGFARAIERGHDVVVEMDADLSHDPAALPSLLAAIDAGADLVIGSRYIPGGAMPNWRLHRRALSKAGNAYAAKALGLHVTDATSGFRAFRSDVLAAVDYASTTATGYAFQIELAARVANAGGTIAEVPIVFADRVVGRSKMSLRITIEALVRVTWWGIRDRILRRRSSRSVRLASRPRSSA
jgi:dolichol-phosphate mannosyltransferase